MARGRLPFNVGLPTNKGYRPLRASATQSFAPILDQFRYFCGLLQEAVLPDTMLGALEPTLELSQKYVPYATGELHDSAYLEVAEKGRSSTKVEIGYGKDGQAPYALIVHEVPAYHAEPTRYKYLQTAIDEDSRAILDRIAQGIKAETGL